MSKPQKQVSLKELINSFDTISWDLKSHEAQLAQIQDYLAVQQSQIHELDHDIMAHSGMQSYDSPKMCLVVEQYE